MFHLFKQSGIEQTNKCICFGIGVLKWLLLGQITIRRPHMFLEVTCDGYLTCRCAVRLVMGDVAIHLAVGPALPVFSEAETTLCTLHSHHAHGVWQGA